MQEGCGCVGGHGGDCAARGDAWGSSGAVGVFEGRERGQESKADGGRKAEVLEGGCIGNQRRGCGVAGDAGVSRRAAAVLEGMGEIEVLGEMRGAAGGTAAKVLTAEELRDCGVRVAVWCRRGLEQRRSGGERWEAPEWG